MIKYVILIPSFNDWECLNLLIPKIDQALKNTNENVDVLIVNDGSTDSTLEILNKYKNNITVFVRGEILTKNNQT